MAEINNDDLRAAVAEGAVSEAQATRLRTIAEARYGFRANMTEEDEPFEFFRGFSEIFITVGLGLLFTGIWAITVIASDAILIPVVGVVLSWALAEYFMRRRRMSLPSIALASVFAFNFAALLTLVLWPENGDPMGSTFVLICALGLAGTLGYFARFRLPFATFIMGIFGIGVVFGLAAIIDPDLMRSIDNPAEGLFDLRSSSNAALATLVFGILAFLAAMQFDLRDPHRVSRFSACAFWLHVLAAPALVNTFALTLFNIGGPTGYALTALALGSITLLAIIIDRRSFLTAGLIYLGLLVGMALESSGADWAPVLTLLILGAFITGLGAFWTQVRSAIMRGLPEFPTKHRLPPYSEPL